MLLQLIITLCTMQYLILAGFPKDPGNGADQRHCLEVAFLRAGHTEGKFVFKTSVKGTINRYCFAHLFHGNQPLQTPVAPKEKEKLERTLAQWRKRNSDDLAWL